MKRWMWLLVFVVGCAGWSRDCQSCNNGSFGADWLIVQYRYDGTPMTCWRLTNAAVANEHNGIYWQEKSGNMVHLSYHASGWDNLVQVQGGDWEGAARTLGIDLAGCKEGIYHLPDAGVAAPVDGGR